MTCIRITTASEYHSCRKASAARRSETSHASVASSIRRGRTRRRRRRSRIGRRVPCRRTRDQERPGDRRQLSDGIEMEPMPKGAAMGADAVHLELDVHAAKDEAHGFGEDAWIPYLTITYAIEKVGSKFKKSGQLLPMTAGDGPHYANNITMDGPGEYHVSYHIE